MNTTTKEAREAIKEADAILITAGAGMGVDSGLPDFRGNEGFWKAYPPIAKLKLDFSDMANGHLFFKNPDFAWGFYAHRLNLYRETVPHKGFKMLLDLVKEKDNYFVFTSNVDAQFQKAGFDEDRICEVHGSIHHLQCSARCNNEITFNNEIITVDEETLTSKDYPICAGKNCLKPMRPNILMFSDKHWIGMRSALQETTMNFWLEKNKDKKIVIIEIGAGTAVPTVRVRSEIVQGRYNAKLIRINPREAQGPRGTIEIHKSSLEGLKDIL